MDTPRVIEYLLFDSSSVGRRIPELLPQDYACAPKDVADEYRVAPPAECPWTMEEILIKNL